MKEGCETMKKLNRKGFTLAELLIVVAVIAVLVAVAIPTFGTQLEKSRQAVDISNLRSAFAAARLAEITQMIEGDNLKLLSADGNNCKYTAGNATTKAKIECYYDPDTGKLVKDGVDCIKAKGNKVVADTSNLNTIISYGNNNTEKTLTLGNKNIKVTFEENEAGSKVYKLKTITLGVTG